MLTNSELDRRFAYHPPKDEDTRRAHEQIREHCRELAGSIQDRCPEGREKSLAITSLEEAMMWANAAIARPPSYNPINGVNTAPGALAGADQGNDQQGTAGTAETSDEEPEPVAEGATTGALG